MARRINREGFDKLKQWEGCILHAYDDADPKRRPIQPGDVVRGILTIGYGHTGPDVYAGQKISQAQAESLLVKDLARFEKRVEQLVTVRLTDNQFAALVSFDFNTGALHSSTLLKRLNKGEYDCVPYELLRWTKTTINGKKVKSEGLVNRRNAEIGLWATGEFVASNTVPAEPMKKPIITKESVTWGATTVAASGLAGSSLFDGNGPIQWAIAAIFVIGAAVGAYLFLRKRV